MSGDPADNASRNPAGRIIDLYERHASDWDRDRGRILVEGTWIDRFTRLLTANAAVLDLGCGTGDPIGTALARRGFAVTGVDSSAAMIELAASRFPERCWVVGDMRTLALGHRFDGIIAWDSFFHLPPDDQRAMFAVFAAHAAARAALLFTSGPAHGEVVGSLWGEPLYHASLDPEEYRRLLNDAGFAVVAHRSDDPDCGGHTVWLAQRQS